MRKNRIMMVLAIAFPISFSVVFPALAQAQSNVPLKSLGVVTINSGAPTSLPTQTRTGTFTPILNAAMWLS